MEVNPLVSKAFGNMRFPLILGVVLIHSNILSFLPADDAMPVFRKFMTCWRYVLNLCVPAFYFISGYLFFRSGFLNLHAYSDKLRRRWHTLAVPYLLWNLIAFLTTCVKVHPALTDYFPQYKTLFDSWQNVAVGFVDLGGTSYPYDMPLWFIRNLIIAVLISPVLSLMFKYLRWFSLVILCCMIEFLDLPWSLASTVFFFALGGCFPLLRFPVEKAASALWIWLPLFDMTSWANSAGVECFPLWISMTAGVMMLVSLSLLATKSGFKTASILDKSTFFVYASHGLYASVVPKFVLALFPPDGNSEIGFADYIISFLLLAGVSFMLYVICVRLTPALANVLCGSRT